MSLNLSILDNDMSGLQVLSPKSKPRNNNTTTNNNNGIVKPFALNGSVAVVATATTPPVMVTKAML